MQKIINPALFIGLLSILAFPAMAQNGTNSPYTRYGYGDLANRSFGAGRSMGGVGIGLRSTKQINPMNPASYSSMDSMTFLFDFGATGQLSWFDDGVNTQNDINGNVDYMAMQFPIHKQVAMSVGLMPYSHTGYQFGDTKTSTEGLSYREQFNGAGGLNLLYAGLSIDIWKKRLSVGANINYLFGSSDHVSQTVFGSTNSTRIEEAKKLKISGATYDFGLQYTQLLSKTDRIVFGMTFAPKIRLNNTVYETIVNGNEVIADTANNLAYDKPMEYGFGVSYTKTDKFIAAIDISFQEWNNASFAGRSNEFKNRTKIAAGFEYIPNLYSRPYLNRTRYRVGVNYTDSYIQVGGNGYKEYGATLGAGFPISDGRSFVNVSFEYVKINASHKMMIDEQYLRMTLSYTFNERWFFKRKVE